MADRMIFHKTILTGGAADSLDNISGIDRGDTNPLQNNDAAFIMETDILSAYLFDDVSTDAEVVPGIIRPDDIGVGDPGRWIRQTLNVSGGGTGVTTVTDHGVLVGSGTGAITPLTVGTNGQVLVGSTGADPVFATITDGDGIDTTLGAGTLSIACEAASDTNSGISELAIASEINTGTDADRSITPDAFAGSNFGKRFVEVVVVNFTTPVTTGNGKLYFVVPDEMNGMNLVRVAATVITAGVVNSTTIAVYNVTDSEEMLSTLMAIETAETSTRSSATPGVIDTDHDDVITGDILRIDVDTVSVTPPNGLIVELVFQLP